MSFPPNRTDLTLGKYRGASPGDDRYYVIVFFDISNSKKYRMLLKVLKSYGSRIQKSVFEAQLKKSQIKELLASIEKLMASERYFDPADNIRLYKIAGNCEATVFGSCENNFLEDNIFI